MHKYPVSHYDLEDWSMVSGFIFKENFVFKTKVISIQMGYLVSFFWPLRFKHNF